MEKLTNQPTSVDGKNADSKTTGKKGGKKKLLVIIIIFVLLAVIGVLGAVVYTLSQKGDGEGSGNETYSNGVPSGPKRNTVVTMDNKDEILADLSNKVAGGMFEAKMNVEWVFEDSSKPSENAYVANVPSNGYTIYFDVFNDANGEVVYESPYIPVGSELSNITLASKLSAGTYPCTLTYHLIDANYEDVSTTSVTVTLYVNN